MSFKLERSKASYFADFVVYPLAILSSGFLLCVAPRGGWPHIAVAVLSGLIGWSLLEYTLHRFILHGLEPFRSWSDCRLPRIRLHSPCGPPLAHGIGVVEK